MPENVDQAVIDEILASAEADTPESRLEKLEKEVETLKGSIKRLLIDIRETMNIIENPFQNLQNLTEGALSAAKPSQQIQIVPAPLPEMKEEEEQEEEEKPSWEPQEPVQDTEVSEALETSGIKEEIKPDVGKAEGVDSAEFFDRSLKGVVEQEEEPMLELVEKRAETRSQGLKVEELRDARFNVVTLFNLMEWTKEMLEKYEPDTLRNLLEIVEMTGYINSDSKEFVLKLIDLLTMNDSFEDMLVELYRLHKIMNPLDSSMDSELLTLLLERKL